MNGVQNILLIDDHFVVRKGVEMMLNKRLSDINLYSCENYDEGLEILASVQIDIVLLDINIHGVENVKIMNDFKKIQPRTKILVFSSHDEKQYGLRYIKNGADGFLNKGCGEEIIISALRSVVREGFYYSNELRLKLSESKKNLDLNKNPIENLSNREYEISKMLVSGLGNLEIANKLDIKMSTVSTYKNRVFEKLNITNIVALADLFK